MFLAQRGGQTRKECERQAEEASAFSVGLDRGLEGQKVGVFGRGLHS